MVTFCIFFFQLSKFFLKSAFLIFLFPMVEKFNGFSFLINPKSNGLFLIGPFFYRKGCLLNILVAYSWKIQWFFISNQSKIQWIGSYRSISYTLPLQMFSPCWYVWCKMALADVGVSLPWWCHALVFLAPGYWRLFLNLIIFSSCPVSEKF